MGASLIALIIGAIKPLAELKRKKKEGNGHLKTSELATTIVKTIGFWGILAMLLYAMSKGVLSLDQVDQIIKDINQ